MSLNYHGLDYQAPHWLDKWVDLFVAIVLSIALASFLFGCTAKPKSLEAGLADAEISLTAAIQTGDKLLGAACVDVRTDACGKALAWHATFRAQAAKAAQYINAKDLAMAQAVIAGLKNAIALGIK